MAAAPSRSQQFKDVHLYEEACNSYLSEVQHVQLSEGLPEFGMVRATLGPGVTLGMASQKSRLHTQWRLDTNWTFLSLVCDLPEAVVWNGVRLPTSGLASMKPGADHEIATPKGFAEISVHLSDAVLEAEGLAEHPVLAPVRPGRRGRSAADHFSQMSKTRALQHTRRLRRLLRQALQSRNRQILRRQVLDSLIDMLEEIDADANLLSRPGVGKYQLVRRARALIEESPARTLRMDTLAAELGASTRTLQRCFQDVLGVTPMQYQRALKLDCARRTLRTRNDRGAIKALARELDFTSNSRFTEYYRRHYGETPSSTMLRS